VTSNNLMTEHAKSFRWMDTKGRVLFPGWDRAVWRLGFSGEVAWTLDSLVQLWRHSKGMKLGSAIIFYVTGKEKWEEQMYLKRHKSLHLVLDERSQRRNDDGDTRCDEGRKLVTQTLSTTYKQNTQITTKTS
jgi:hypothetical protein